MMGTAVVHKPNFEFTVCRGKKKLSGAEKKKMYKNWCDVFILAIMNKETLAFSQCGKNYGRILKETQPVDGEQPRMRLKSDFHFFVDDVSVQSD